VQVPNGLVRDTLVEDDDLGEIPSRLEPNRDALGCGPMWLQAPRVDEAVRWVNHFEVAGNPHDRSVRKTIADPVTAANSEIDLCVDAVDTRRAPPLLEM
jgi:hypothetical protein